MSVAVPERQLVDDIAAIEEAFAARHGYFPENVSHWDPGNPYRAAVTSLIPIGDPGDLISYLFNDEFLVDGNAHDLVSRFGFDASNYGSVITSNGTTAITLLLHHLAIPESKRIDFFGPVYFSAVHLARRLGVRHRTSPICWTENGGFSLQETLLAQDPSPETVIWVTNPIYGTGCRIGDDDISVLRKLILDGHMVVVDEAYATDEQRIGPTLSTTAADNLFGIYSPHKTVNVNGLKFAAVIAPKKAAGTLDHLTDIVCGGLTPSNRAALKHYVSGGFAELSTRSKQFIRDAREQIKGVVPSTLCSVSDASTGAFVTINNPRLPAELGWDLNLLQTLAEETGATFIPTCRNWMSPAVGLGFRVNLCRAAPNFWQPLGRLCAAINSMTDVGL